MKLSLVAIFAAMFLGCASRSDVSLAGAAQTSSQVSFPLTNDVILKADAQLYGLSGAPGTLVPLRSRAPLVATIFGQWASDANHAKHALALIRLDSPTFVRFEDIDGLGSEFAFAHPMARSAPIAELMLKDCPSFVPDPRTQNLQPGSAITGAVQLLSREHDYDWVLHEQQVLAIERGCSGTEQPSLSQWALEHDATKKFFLLRNPQAPITLGWEVESANTDIVKSYRRNDFSDGQWLNTGYDARVQHLRTYLQNPNQPSTSCSKVHFEKTTQGLDTWSERLSVDNDMIWEIQTRKPAEDFGEFVSQLTTVAEFNGNTHLHVVFNPQIFRNDAAQLRRLRTLFIVTNVYLTLVAYGNPDKSYRGHAAEFLNIYLHPLQRNVMDHFEAYVTSDDYAASLDFKWLFFGYRFAKLYGADANSLRHGLEMRLVGESLEAQVDLAWRVATALENLDGPFVRFNPKSPIVADYTLDDMADKIETLLDPPDMADVAAQCCGITSEQISSYQQTLTRIHVEFEDMVKKYPFLAWEGTSWMAGKTDLVVKEMSLLYPLLPWEELPWLAAKKDLIIAARQKYIREVFQALSDAQLQTAEQTRRLGYTWSALALQWAHTTALWEDF